MNTTGNWEIKVSRATKTVDMVVTGSFTTERAMEFVKDYHSKINPIKATEYLLKLDCRDLELVKADRVKDLENCFALYKESGFQEVILEINKNVILKMQLNRLAKNAGLTNAKVVEL